MGGKDKSFVSQSVAQPVWHSIWDFMLTTLFFA